MKKFVTLAMMALLLSMASCNDKLKQTEAENGELKGDLRETLATQDSLFALLNDISDGMNQIKELERIATSPEMMGAENSSRKDEIQRDMRAIQQALQERRQRLEQLEQRIRALGNENSELQRTINTLRQQLADQQTEIVTLTNQLAQANIRIEQLGSEVTSLNNTVDTLNRTVASERRDRQTAQVQAENATNQLNTCYYAIGSKNELKDHGILQSGFLRRTKIMQGEFDQTYFMTGDKRSLHVIPLHSKKAKVLTSQPKDSYEIETDSNGMKILRITDSTRFWQQSNFLVVQID